MVKRSPIRDSSQIELARVGQEFLDTIGVARSTRANYRDALDKFLSYLPSSPPPTLQDLDRTHVAAYRVWLEDQHLEPGTIHQRIRVLKRLGNWLVEADYVDISPLEKVKLPRNPVKPKTTLTGKEVKQLLSGCVSDRDKAVVALMLDAGLRRAEVCDLETANLDLDNQRIVLVGKGRKTRIVSCPLAAKYIRAYLDKRPKVDDPHLFLTVSRPYTPMGSTTIVMLFRHLRDRTGLTHVHPHKLRHTMATMFYNTTGDIVAVQQILGHADLETTRRYIQRDIEDSLTVHRQNSPLGELLGVNRSRSGKRT